MMGGTRNRLRPFSCQEVGCWPLAGAALDPESLAKPNKLRLPGLMASPAVTRQLSVVSEQDHAGQEACHFWAATLCTEPDPEEQQHSAIVVTHSKHSSSRQFAICETHSIFVFTWTGQLPRLRSPRPLSQARPILTAPGGQSRLGRGGLGGAASRALPQHEIDDLDVSGPQ